MNSPYPEVAIGSLASPEKGSFKIGPFGSSLKKAELVEDGIPVVGIENVLPNQFVPSFRKFITLDKFKQLSQYKIEPFDILVTTMGTIGRSVVAPQNIGNAIIDSHLFRMRVDRSKVEPAYLCYALNGFAPLKKQIENKSVGAIMAGLNTTILKECTIPLPPLEEQKRIAARLDEQMHHIEQARLAAEESLSAAWELEKTYLLELFGTTSNKFQTTNIGSVAKIQTGYAFKSEWFSPDGIRLLRNANVFQGYIDWGDCVRIPESRRNEFESFEMHEGDIVLSLDRPLVNNGLKVARLTPNDIPSLLLQRVARFQVSENILPDYLYLFLRSPYFIDEITQHDQSIGVPHVSPKQVEAINLPLPDLKAQEKLSKEYQEKLLHTKQLIHSLESQLAEIESLPSAVLGQAFAGEL